MADPTLFPPAQVRPANTHSERVSRAKAHAHTHDVAGRQKLDAARKCGEELIALKSEVRPGEFLATLRTLWPELSIRTAQYWMAVARNWKAIQNAKSLPEAEEIALADADALEEETLKPESNETRNPAHQTSQSSECETSKTNSGSKLKTGTPVKPTTGPPSPPPPPTPETSVDRTRRIMMEILDQLSQVSFRIEDAIKSAHGPQMLELAEELKVEVRKEYQGETDRFDRESDTKGERHYYPEPLLALVEWVTTFESRLANPAEVDF